MPELFDVVRFSANYSICLQTKSDSCSPLLVKANVKADIETEAS